MLLPTELPSLSLLDQARRVRWWCRELGTSVIPQQSRIHSLCQLVEAAGDRVITPSDHLHASLVQANKDIQEFWFIFETIGTELNRTPFVEKLRRAVNDDIEPATSGDTTGRDAQMELLVGAIVLRSGAVLDNSTTAGPDWIVEFGSDRWSIEVKRIKSFGKLQHRIQEGARQIAASGIGGVIVLDISLPANRAGSRLARVVSDELLRSAQRARYKHLWKQIGRNVRRWIGRRPVGTVIFHDYLLTPQASADAWTLTNFWDASQLHEPGSVQHLRYLRLFDLFDAGMPNT